MARSEGVKAIGVVLAGHGNLAQELAATAEMIVGHGDGIATVDLSPGTGLDGLDRLMRQAVDRVDEGLGVLVLVDLFGGTPSNAAALGIRERKVEVVAGVNLPMLLEVLTHRDSGLTLTSLSEIAVRAGRSGVTDVRERLDDAVG